MTDEIKVELDGKEIGKAITDETDPTDESLKTDETKDDIVDSKHIPYDRFKEKVDEANKLKEELAEIKQAQEEAKHNELKEAEDWKELAQSLEEKVTEYKTEALESTKTSIMLEAGYTPNQVERLSKYLNGDTAEDLKTALEDLKKDIPPQQKQYADPQIQGNNKRQKPDKQDGEDVGKSLYERIKGKL